MVELRDKVPTLILSQDVAIPAKQTADEVMIEDALSALVNLGYKKAVAKRAIDEAQQRLQGEATLEILLKESLRSIA